MIQSVATLLRRFLLLVLVLSVSAVGGIVFGNLVVVLGATGRVEGVLNNLEPAEVGLILGAGPGSPTLDARLEAGLELWEAGLVPRLLVSGGSDGTGYGETEYMWRFLRRHGVPAEDIVVDPLGLRTLDSVRRAQRVFGFTSVIVVTQRYHAYRGVFLARFSRLEAEGYAAFDVDSDELRFSQRREWLARPVAVFDLVTGRSARFGDEAPTLTNHPAK
ncbi:MAG: vancomycin high temperature exclusion protein [Opitutales bacterium]